MPVPVFTDDDYTRAMQALLPRGWVWPREPDAIMTKVLRSLAPTYTRSGARLVALLTETFPFAPVELLPEWEASLGLPDPCAGLGATIEARQQQVNARFIAGGGQSIGFFISFALALGYVITITQFAPFRVGINHAGDPLYGANWAHAWQVNAPTVTTTFFEAGHNSAGDPLASFGNTVLQCELLRLAPAQTTLIFSYS